MENTKNKIIKQVQEEVELRCKSPNNFFTYSAYYHIESVVENGIFLAKQYGADVEIVTLACWLHDIASVTNKEYYKQHHIHGAKIAKEMLKKLNYPEERIIKIQNCILNHRGSILKEKSTMEEICVADADAVSHLYNVPRLFHLSFSR